MCAFSKYEGRESSIEIAKESLVQEIKLMRDLDHPNGGHSYMQFAIASCLVHVVVLNTASLFSVVKMLAYSEGETMLIVMEILKCSVKEYVDHQVPTSPSPLNAFHELTERIPLLAGLSPRLLFHADVDAIMWQLKQTKDWKIPAALAVNWSLHLFNALKHLHSLSSPIMRESPSMCSV
jgi:hypothetical protein